MEEGGCAMNKRKGAPARVKRSAERTLLEGFIRRRQGRQNDE
jgi:hypothetical protein